jgi:hypothetical protein
MAVTELYRDYLEAWNLVVWTTREWYETQD